MSKTTENKSVFSTFYPEEKTRLAEELDTAKPSEISHRNEVTRKKLLKTALSGAIRYTAMLACFLIFLGSAGYIASYAMQYIEKEQQTRYFEKIESGEIKMLYLSVASKGSESVGNVELGQSMQPIDIVDVDIHTGEYNEYFEKKRAMILGRQRSYPDVWGWIDVPGTKVNYIVMQGKDNSEYLYADYDKSYTRYGSIFADFRDSRNVLENRNTVIYGHNMNTAHIMFAPLLDFAIDEEAFRNQTINIITPDGLYTYELFSIYDTKPTYNYIETYFSSDEDFLDFVQRCKNKSIWQKDIEITADSKLLTLSTCTVRNDGMRWALHAVLIGISK